MTNKKTFSLNFFTDLLLTIAFLSILFFFGISNSFAGGGGGGGGGGGSSGISTGVGIGFQGAGFGSDNAGQGFGGLSGSSSAGGTGGPGGDGGGRNNNNNNQNCTNWSGWSDCTVTCGGGQQTRSRTCSETTCAQMGRGGCIRSSYRTWTDTETRDCNTQACCTSHDYKSCYAGDSYWYDSCGNKEGRADNCLSYETCSNGVCICNETCASRNFECGLQNICGKKISCGTCGRGLTCGAGTCIVQNPGLNIAANPGIVRKNKQTKITWSVDNYADSCKVTGPSFHKTGIDGNATTTISNESIFTLTCTNQSKKFSKNVTVKLVPQWEEF